MNKIYFNKKALEVFLSSFFVYVIAFVCEALVGAIIMVVFNTDGSHLLNTYAGQFYINIIISLTKILFVNLRKSIKIFKFFADAVKIIKFYEIIPLILLILLTYSAFFYYIYFQINEITILILSNIMIFVICLLIMAILNEKMISVNLKKEYEELINNLNEYEKILEKYRITNHENLNNFIVIKGMLEENQKDVIKQIDEIIKFKQQDDNELLFKTKKLPTGGLQGLVYQKMLTMKENNIICNLEISKNIDVAKMKLLDFELIKNICAIIGIFLDNAIEAVSNLEKKIVGIYIYIDDENKELCFAISNNFSGFIDLDKIDNKGYSSKGSGRGYGLSLVKRIVDSDNRISLKREIMGDMFKQTIKIKMLV